MPDQPSIDEVFDAYAKVFNSPPDQFPVPDFLFMSIDQLQILRPEFTEEALIKAGCIRGVHLVAIVKGEISFVTPDECP